MRALLVVVSIVFALAMTACGSGDSGAAGAACTPTQEGASRCQTGVCLAGIQCNSGKVLNACAGPACTGGGTCPGGMECVPVTGTGTAYCLPTSICQ